MSILDKIRSPDGIQFLDSGKWFMAISIGLVVGAVALIGIKGFNYGIDFVGGTEVQVMFNGEMKPETLRGFLTGLGYPNAVVQKLGEEETEPEFLIRLESLQGATEEETNELLSQTIAKITSELKTQFAGQQPEMRRVDTVGPQVGNQLRSNAMLATFYALLLILVYIGLRFDYKYAPGAVFCLLHDALITVGIFALFGLEVNVQTLAAVLTVIGYSLNDTIIIFDRIRENIATYRDRSFYWICNRAINDTLSRTFLTTFTTLLAVGAMYILAGGVIADFAFALGLGIIVGTYSTIYVATPIVILMDRVLEGQEKAARVRAAAH